MNLKQLKAPGFEERLVPIGSQSLLRVHHRSVSRCPEGGSGYERPKADQMSREVFISHSSSDVDVAREICATLELSGVTCWMAPRDIAPGESWSGAIVQAIRESTALVVIVSSFANASSEVLREVELASRGKKTLIGVRVEDVPPSNDLGYFLSSIQWVDAFPPPIPPKLAVLATAFGSAVDVSRIGDARQQEETPKEPAFVEVDLDDFNKSRERRAGFLRRMLDDR